MSDPSRHEPSARHWASSLGSARVYYPPSETRVEVASTRAAGSDTGGDGRMGLDGRHAWRRPSGIMRTKEDFLRRFVHDRRHGPLSTHPLTNGAAGVNW